MSEENNDIAQKPRRRETERERCARMLAKCQEEYANNPSVIRGCLRSNGCAGFASIEGGEEVANATPPMCTPVPEKQTGSRER